MQPPFQSQDCQKNPEFGFSWCSMAFARKSPNSAFRFTVALLMSTKPNMLVLNAPNTTAFCWIVHQTQIHFEHVSRTFCHQIHRSTACSYIYWIWIHCCHALEIQKKISVFDVQEKKMKFWRVLQQQHAVVGCCNTKQLLLAINLCMAKAAE